MLVLMARASDRTHAMWVGDLARRTTLELGMTDKEVAYVQGYPDSSQWCKALKGEAPLDLLRMVRLPIRFWQLFLPKLASALIAQHFEDLFGTPKMAKAEMPTHDQQKRSA